MPAGSTAKILRGEEGETAPEGAVALWDGNLTSTPDGWALCDGAGSTPDLRNQFTLCAGGARNYGDTGGADSVTLSTSQIASHNHGSADLSVDTDGTHSHGLFDIPEPSVYNAFPPRSYNSGTVEVIGAENFFGIEDLNTRTTQSNGGHSHSSLTGTFASTGGGASHENRPQFHSLGYIMVTDSVAAEEPTGLIMNWSGSIASIPTDWTLCDGNNGTPDLTDSFVPGAGDTYSLNQTGGSNEVSLSQSEMPAHDHTGSSISTDSVGGHTHDYKSGSNTTLSVEDGTDYVGADPNNTVTNTSLSGGGHSHNISGTSGNAGGGAAHENKPPYYALAYMMKL